MFKYIFLSAFIISTCTSLLQAQKITLLQEGKATSVRGLSVVDNKTAWISGSKGHIAITLDGGKNWEWQQVKGYEQADFRDIEAFSATEAIIMSSGTPALILKTTDAGKTWQLKYKNADKAYFLDAMDFDGKKHGFILGDPVNGKFLMLETTDGGDNWHPFGHAPDALPGEAAFAASGTCLRLQHKQIGIVTGGTVARCLIYNTPDTTWLNYQLPIAQGKDSKGAFSLSLQSGWMLTGGDYVKNKIADSTTCYFTADINVAFKPANTMPAGFQSCIEQVKNQVFISTGTSGSNLSTDNGRNWVQIDTGSFNVCRKAKKGNMVLLAGDKGRIGILML